MINGMSFDNRFSIFTGEAYIGNQTVNDDDIRSSVVNAAFSPSDVVDPSVMLDPSLPEDVRASVAADKNAMEELAYKWNFETTPRDRAVSVFRSSVARSASGMFDGMYASFGLSGKADAARRAEALHLRRTGAMTNAGAI